MYSISYDVANLNYCMINFRLCQNKKASRKLIRNTRKLYTRQENDLFIVAEHATHNLDFVIYLFACMCGRSVTLDVVSVV